MRKPLRNGAILALVLAAASALGGCVVAPGYYHRGYGYHDGYRHNGGHHGYWR